MIITIMKMLPPPGYLLTKAREENQTPVPTRHASPSWTKLAGGAESNVGSPNTLFCKMSPPAWDTYTIAGEMDRGVAKSGVDRIGNGGSIISASGAILPDIAPKDLKSLWDGSVSNGLRAQVIAARASLANVVGDSQLRDAKRAAEGIRFEIDRLHNIGAINTEIAAGLLRLLPTDGFKNIEDWNGSFYEEDAG